MSNTRSCSVPLRELPPKRAVLLQYVFPLAGYRIRRYRVEQVRPHQERVFLRELPSEANPNPRGPGFWASLQSQGTPLGLFSLEKREGTR